VSQRTSLCEIKLYDTKLSNAVFGVAQLQAWEKTYELRIFRLWNRNKAKGFRTNVSKDIFAVLLYFGFHITRLAKT